MQDKPAHGVSKTANEPKLETMNGDLMDMKEKDCAGNRYPFNTVMLQSRLGMSEGLKNKSSIEVTKAFTKMKAWVEAKTDPGDKTGYKIQVFSHDPGTEFQGAMQEELAKHKIMNRIGEVDRHTDNSVVENRNKRVGVISTAIAITAMGENIEKYAPKVGCELAKWATDVVNHTSITKEQKESGKTAWQEQFGTTETLVEAYGIPIHSWGELTYVFLKKRDRNGKLSPRAVKCIWNGPSRKYAHSICAIPITQEGDGWKLHKPISSAQVKVIRGVFPLKEKPRNHDDYESSFAAQQEVWSPNDEDWCHDWDETEPEEQPDASDDDDDDQYEIENILEHNSVDQGKFEYKVRWKGWGPAHDTWCSEADLENCQETLVAYWRQIANSESNPEHSTGMTQDQINTFRGGKSAGGMAEFDLETPVLREPDFKAIICSAGGTSEEVHYQKSIHAMLRGSIATESELADELSEMCGGAEIPLPEILKPAAKAEFKAAHNREIEQMTKRRFVKDGHEATKQSSFIPIDQLTPQMQKTALKCRMSYSRKRPELDSGEQEGKAKARLVAMDLKIFNTKPKTSTYAGTPTAEGARLIIASVDLKKGDKVSSSDFDTAFLQAFSWKDGRLMLIKYWDPFLDCWVYEWIDGAMYGMQEASLDWKETLCYRLTTEMGFKEVANLQSVYHHPERKITVPVHVDDPLVKSSSEENKIWFHKTIEELFDTKGMRELEIGHDLDYLSIRISMTPEQDIMLDNQAKIEQYLEEKGLSDCNAGLHPIDRTMVIEMMKDCEEQNLQTDDEAKETSKWLGEAMWLSQTTHPTLAVAVSIYASLTKHRPKSSQKAMKMLFRYIKGQKDFGLRNEYGNTEGLQISSDSDFAGLYKITNGKEMRSRTGIIIKYRNMPFSWRSGFQACKASEMTMSHVAKLWCTVPSESSKRQKINDPVDVLIATSTCDAETHAAADAAKLGLHFKYVCEEIDIPAPSRVPIIIDASAAEGFINNTETVGKMKHIDLREHWVKILRNSGELKFIRRPGTENEADFFTKIIVGPAHKEAVARLLTKLPTKPA